MDDGDRIHVLLDEPYIVGLGIDSQTCVLVHVFVGAAFKWDWLQLHMCVDGASAPVSRTYMGPDASRLPVAGPVSTTGPSKRPMLGSGPVGS